MRISEYFPFLIIASAFLFVSWKAYTFVGTSWWDECVYMGLAKSLVEKHVFEINLFHQEAFRPPLYPFLLAILYFIFGFSIKLAYLFNLLLTVASAFVIYEIARRCWNDVAAVLSSFLFFSFSELVFWSTKALVEPLEIFFVSLFLFLWMCARDERKMLLSVPLVTVAFLSKYTLASLFILFVIAILIKGKIRDWLISRRFWFGVMIASFILLPWIIHGCRVYNSPIGSATYNLYIVNNITKQSPWYYYLLNFYNIFKLQGIIFLAGVIYALDKRERSLFLPILWFAIYFALMSFVVGEKNYRYMLPVLPAIVIVSARFLERLGSNSGIGRAIVLSTVSLIFVLYLPSAVHQAYVNKTARSEIIEIAKLIKEGAGGNIMSSSYPIYSLLTGREVIYFPKDEWAMDKFIKKYNVAYIIIDSCENKPEWVERYIEKHADRFQEIYKHTGWCNVRVYKVKK